MWQQTVTISVEKLQEIVDMLDLLGSQLLVIETPRIRAKLDKSGALTDELESMIEGANGDTDGYWVWRDGNAEFESSDKHSTDVDPVLDYINQHTTVRHMTPPLVYPAQPVETTSDTPRCGCGEEADYYRAGKHWCAECLIEGDVELD